MRDVSSPNNAGVVVDDLCVSYGSIVAVDHASFTAPAGQVTVVLGPNGAGKTSTIEVCEGFRRATSGHVSVLGLHPEHDHHQLTKLMGVMLQGGGIYPSARVRDVVALFCALYGDTASPDDLIDLVGLGERRTSTWRRLSGGEQQRLSLAIALAAKPRVAFLDEPTSGVDIDGRATIRTIVRGLADEGVTVVLATHELDEAERIADNIVVFNKGRVLASGSLNELRAGHDEITFTSSIGIDVVALSAAVGTTVSVTSTQTVYRIASSSNPRLIASLSGWLADQGLPMSDLRAGNERLEDMFRRITGGGGT